MMQAKTSEESKRKEVEQSKNQELVNFEAWSPACSRI